MAVLEGYAEHVMDAVGAELLPDLPQLRGALDRRRRDRSGLLRLFEKLIGLDMKLRQYEQGKRFCDAVADGRRDRARSTACGRSRPRCRRWPSSTIRTAGSPARAPRAPPDRRDALESLAESPLSCAFETRTPVRIVTKS